MDERGVRNHREQGGVLVEDSRLEPAQRRRRLEAEVLHEPGAGPAVRRQRVALTSRAVQRGDQLFPRPFSVGLVQDPGLQLGHQVRTGAQRQGRVHLRLLGDGAQLGQAQPLGHGERRVRELGVRLAAPPGQGLVQQCQGGLRITGGQCGSALVQVALEAPRVHARRVDGEPVSAGLGDERRALVPASEVVAQPYDVALQRLLGGHGWGVRPQVVDQDVHRDGSADPAHERGQESATSRSPEPDQCPVAVLDCQSAQHPEPHLRTVARGVSGRQGNDGGVRVPAPRLGSVAGRRRSGRARAVARALPALAIGHCSYPWP